MSILSSCGDQNIGSMLVTNGSTTTWAPIFTESDIQILLRRIEAIEARLAIIEPNQDLHERFPALQEAYEAYKIIERIVNDKKT